VLQDFPLLAPPSQVLTVVNLLFSKFGQRSTAVQKPGLRRPWAPLPAEQKPAEQVPVLQTPAAVHAPPGQSPTTLQELPAFAPPTQVRPQSALLVHCVFTNGPLVHRPQSLLVVHKPPLQKPETQSKRLLNPPPLVVLHWLSQKPPPPPQS